MLDAQLRKEQAVQVLPRKERGTATKRFPSSEVTLRPVAGEMPTLFRSQSVCQLEIGLATALAKWPESLLWSNYVKGLEDTIRIAKLTKLRQNFPSIGWNKLTQHSRQQSNR